MVLAEMLITTFSVILFAMNLFIGLYLLKRAKITGLTNILWLCYYFFFTVIELVSKMVYAFGRPTIGVNFISFFFFSINLTGQVFLLFFVKYTFYVDRKSPFFILLPSAIIAKIAYIVTYSITEIEQNLLLYVIQRGIGSFIIFISSFWLCYAALSSYHNIKKQTVAPWVKKRYLIVGISPIFLIAQIIPMLLTPYRGSFSDPFMAILVMILTFLNIIFALLSLFAWVMPKWLKNYLNQGYESQEEDMTSSESEDALIEKLKSQLARGGTDGGN
ncbi:MAG: hypothetical protein MUP85_14060 [Candidatus Lokiarchaeota archaeon]|nr:hypothetical protein [Candidatus Lokiarchaeota archaeon]